MSGAITAIATGFTLASQSITGSGLVPAWLRHPRRIGTIIPDCTIEESHNDRVQLTQHPIADGSPITDHAYVIPPTLTLRVGWTNANLFGGLLEGGNPFGAFLETRVSEVYKTMLDLQAARQPIEIVTGKRSYKDMMLVDLSTKTDHTTEYSLILECHFQNVMRVTTKKTTQPALSMQPAGDKTAGTVDAPPKQPAANPEGVPNSFLKDIKTGFLSFLGFGK